MVSQEHPPLPIEIRHGADVKQLLDAGRLHELTKHVVEHTTGLQQMETYTSLQHAMLPAAQVFPRSVRGFLAKTLPSLFGTTPQIGLPQSEIEYVKQFLNDEQLWVATLNGEAIGMLGYKEGGQMPEGPNDPPDARRTVYEMCRASTLPIYEGKGVFSQLRKEVFDTLRREYPDAPILAVTKSQTVKNRSLQMGYEEIPVERLLQIRGFTPEEIPEFAKQMKAKDPNDEWRVYLFDPLKRTT